MKWFALILFLQLAMWGAAEEPPGPMEGGPPDEPVANLKESCEQSKSQLESLKEIMLRNKQSLKKKEEEIQEYARKLTKFKTRAKLSRRSKGEGSGESTPKSTSEASLSETLEELVDDISQAKTPKAKSSLLQKKLAEDKKIFKQRSKKITESKRAIEEKVEAIRQQLEEREQQTALPVNPVVSQAATPLMQMSFQQDKDNKIAELSNRILELEATVQDLRENLREKDSVIDSKTKAVTLMSADLSMKGKTTLDTLEDTKDEMRTMQEHFVLLESSLRSKNDNLLDQLREKNDRIVELEETLKRFEDQLEAQKLAESVSVDFSRSTMDTLADTKDAMKSMQENFVLIESSLKSKNDHLLKQLEEREIKLAEAKETIFKLESGAGITRPPETEELEYKLQKVEESNRRLQDEKYELQKNNAELQNRVIALESSNGNGVIVEKDNRIAELESLIEELKKSNQLLEEESKAELQKQVTELLAKNEEISNKVIDLEKLVHDLEIQKNELAAKIPCESQKADEKVVKLTKELDDMNKGMIKLKVQHKSKVKNLQRQLESFRKVSDANAELVRLGNQVALLEEEKASAGDWKEQIADLEGKVNAQAKEIETHIEAIAALENQKLDLMQELHSVKQEISTLEAENAESENLRVTAEMKVVDLEEQLESLNRTQNDQKQADSSVELTQKIESLTRENEGLIQKVSKLEEKGTSDSGSTESFETLHETDRSDLLKRIEDLSQRNNELTKKLSTLEEKTESNVGSTESFESINDTDKNDLLKRIDALTREKNDLVIKLSKIEEKGSSDTGSTESFEKIPEQSDSTTKIEMLTRENNELVIKLTKLEEKLEDKLAESSKESRDVADRIRRLVQENNELVIEVTKLKERSSEKEKLSLESHLEANEDLQLRIKSLMEENEDLKQKLEHLSATVLEKDQPDSGELSQKLERLSQEKEALLERVSILEEMDNQEKSELKETESATIASLESEIESCRKLIEEQKDMMEDMKLKLIDKKEELERKIIEIKELESTGADVQVLRKDLEDSTLVIEEWKRKCDDMQEKMNDLEAGKASIEEGLQHLQDENRRLLEQVEQKEEIIKSLKQELDNTISFFESKLEEQATLVTAKEKEIAYLKDLIKNKEKDLTDKYAQLQNEMITIDSLQDELDQRKNDLQQKDAAIVSLTEEVNELKVSYKKEIASAKKQIEELNTQLQFAKSPEEFEELLHQLRDKDELLDQLQAKLESQESEINDLQAQIENTNSRFKEFETEANQRAQELEDARTTADQLGEKLKDAETAKAEGEKQIEYVQNMLDSNAKHAEDLKTELSHAYQTLEQLKMKHMEDMEMQNRRLEDIIEDLHNKIQESESMKLELERSHMLIGQNFTEETKKSLEAKVSDLEQQLAASVEKSQKQLEKMKKIAVNLKKKSAQCEELESKVSYLEEKLTLEKDEKEAKNREIQEKDAALKDKEIQISSLEERFFEVQSEKQEALLSIESLTAELNESKQRLESLMKLVLEMGEESFEGMIEKCKKQQEDLDEAKDNVRELSVRMQVMETEYVEQLSLIQSLKTENGMVLSKQTQINERLENAEKESDDRRILLEKLQMELEKRDTELAELTAKKETELAVKQVQETEAIESTDPKEGSSTQCERCDQCQTLVHTLEARLQERDAEIENLDNELANSVVNFVQMQDNLRINMNQSAGHNRSLQEPYNDLMMQYNALSASNEEIKERLNETLKENQELTEKIESLKDLNVTLEERTAAVEKELTTGKVTTETLQTELESTQEQLLSARSQVDENDSEKQALLDKYRELEVSRDRLTENLTQCHQKISALESELENLKKTPREQNTNLERPKRDLELSSEPTPLFDASKAFGSAPLEVSDHLTEIRELRQIISEKENLCSSLSAEIERLKTDQSLSARVQELEVEKSNYEVQLQSLLLEKQEIDNVLQSQMIEFEAVRIEKEELVASHELCKFKILQLENEIKNSSDTGRVRELEVRASNIQKENSLLQLQVTDLKRSLADVEESSVPFRNLQDIQAELDVALRERDQLSLQVDNLTQTLKKFEHSSDTRNQAVVPVEKKLKKVTVSATESNWETEMEKVEVDDEAWGWNPEDAQLVDNQHLVMAPLVSSVEVQLQTRIDELEDQLKDLETEKTRILEDNRNVQTKCGKLVKKLKEYKFQVESLQQQLKSRKLKSDLCDLDSVFNDEMNSQITGLEKALAETKEDHKKTIAEKENLIKRLDVLMAANERHVEMKERQDMQVEVLEIRNKELTNRFEVLQKQLQEGNAPKVLAQASSQVSPQEHESTSADEVKYKQELNDLRSAVDDLAAENDQLQQLLEEQRTNRLAMESKLSESTDFSSKLEESNMRNAELQKDLDKLKEEYSNLRKQYEQSLMDANDQVQVMRQNSDILKEELSRKREEFDSELLTLRKEAEISVSKMNEELQQALRKKEELREVLNQRIQEIQSLRQESEVCAENVKAGSELQVVIQGLSQEVSTKQEAIENLKKTLIVKEEEFLVLKKFSEELESANSEGQNRFHQMEVSLQTYLAELETKNGIIESQEHEIQRLMASLDDKILRETELTQKMLNLESDLQQYVSSLQSHETNLQLLQNRVSQAEHEVNESRRLLAERDSTIQGFEQELQKCRQELETSRLEIEQLVNKLQVNEQELERLSDMEDNKTENYNVLNIELQTKKQELNDMKQALLEKDTIIEDLEQKLDEKQSEIDKMSSGEPPKTVDGIPVFRMGGPDDQEIEQLKAELNKKQLHIEHLESVLNENTYPKIIQELQDTVNQLYNEKAQVELTLVTLSQNLQDQLNEKQEEIQNLRQELEVQRQEMVLREDSARVTRKKRSLDEEDENQRLRDTLRAWEQEVEDLRQVLAEKEAQLLHDSSFLDKETIQRLMSEKEQIRLDAEETLERKMSQKEMEIEDLKSRLQAENERLLTDLKLKEKDIENLRIQVAETSSEHDEQLQKKSAEVVFTRNDLAERDRKIAELSITKDAEIHNLNVQIHDKEMKIEELQALSEEEERQLSELKLMLESRDQKVNDLKQQLEEKVKELEFIQHALKRHIAKSDSDHEAATSLSREESLDASANELDLALYMLHQRDVRCEELTLELMQLLEERDTLQLRLSNAIRVNEELRRTGSPKKSPSSSSGNLPLVEDPSPSRAEGPVEIAKDALDSSIGENKEALAQKLSQLHTVGHTKDVRLRDERELRHTQQMSLLTHKDVLSTLPPEAAARLVNANYTLSRDVQSQSSVLMNWLWGKSTPKVMHM